MREDADRLVREFNRLSGRAEFSTESSCVKSRFIRPKTGERVDATRQAIASKGLAPALEAVMRVSRMEAADRVDAPLPDVGGDALPRVDQAWRADRRGG